MAERKPILCLDFDGVLHSYTSGWQGATVIPDPPVPGAIDFMARAKQDFDLHIFSSRSNAAGGIDAMRRWLRDAIEYHFDCMFVPGRPDDFNREAGSDDLDRRSRPDLYRRLAINRRTSEVPTVEQATGNLTAKFFGNGRQPQCEPNPAYPNGIEVDAAMGAPGCSIALRHPTSECGQWYIHCSRCGTSAIVTAAARPDDPSKVTLPCEAIAFA